MLADKAPSTTRSRGLEAQQDVLIDRVVGAHPVETALQFAGVPTAYLSAVRATQSLSLVEPSGGEST